MGTMLLKQLKREVVLCW